LPHDLPIISTAFGSGEAGGFPSLFERELGNR
jgi:hypothetical protein